MRTSWIRTGACALVVAVVATLAGPVGAGLGAQDNHESEVREQLGEVTRAEAEALGQLLDTQAARRDQETQLAGLQLQVAAAQAEVTRIDGELVVLQGKIDATKAELRAARKSFQQSAGGAYQTSQSGKTYDSILAARPNDMVSSSQYLEAISETRSGQVNRIERLERQLEQQQHAVEAQRAAADQERARVDQLRAAQQAAVDAIAQQQRQEEELLAGFHAQRVSFERELGVLQASSDSINATLEARGSTAGPGNGKCEARPVAGSISSPFGTRVHPVLGTVRMHNGLDMSGSMGEPILACRPGVVVIAGPQGGYGNAVVIDHGGGMATLYAHQSKIAVSVGDQISTAQVIGYVGSTGMSTGPHLHFEVRLSGVPVNGLAYL